MKLKLSSLFLLLLICLFNPVKVWGQGTKITPDCVVLVNITLAAQTTVAVPTTPTTGGVGDNRTEACQTYTFEYQATGAGALTGVEFQAGKSASTTVTFATWAGTVNTGINPNTSSTGATSTFSTGCASMAACTVANSWLRILITRGTFVGTINGVLYGYKSDPGANGGGGSVGCPGTAATPCVVDGVTAAGSPPTTPPVLVAGQDGAPGNIRTVKTDSNGSLIPSNASSADADAVSNTQITATGAAGGILYPRVFNRVFNGTTWDRMPGNTSGVAQANAALAGADGVGNTVASPSTVAGAQLYARMFPYFFNGSTNDREYSCPNSAVITFSAASGTLEIVALTASQIIRICHISLSSTAATNITLVYGTGTNCGTGTTSISGAYQQVTTLALDFRMGAEPRTAVSNAFCITSSVSATVGGMVTYAKF